VYQINHHIQNDDELQKEVQHTQTSILDEYRLWQSDSDPFIKNDTEHALLCWTAELCF